MNEERLTAAILSAERDGGIGTLGEKTLHAVLKYYFEPDSSHHEVKVGGKIADIRNADGITEIQTRSCEKLLKKLPALLGESNVRVVLPFPYRKWLAWVDPSTGEMSKPRKSPKTGSVFDALYELGKLKQFIGAPGFSVTVILLDMEEHRSLDGWGNGGKRGSHRLERFPLRVEREIELSAPEDYRILVPSGLSAEFTLKEYAAAAKVNYRRANAGVAILRKLGIIRHVGKRGRENLYSLT